MSWKPWEWGGATWAMIVGTVLVGLLTLSYTDNRTARERAQKNIALEIQRGIESRRAATRRIDQLTNKVDEQNLLLQEVLAAGSQQDREAAVARSRVRQQESGPAGQTGPPSPSPSPAASPPSAPPTTQPPQPPDDSDDSVLCVVPLVPC